MTLHLVQNNAMFFLIPTLVFSKVRMDGKGERPDGVVRSMSLHWMWFSAQFLTVSIEGS